MSIHIPEDVIKRTKNSDTNIHVSMQTNICTYKTQVGGEIAVWFVFG